VGCAFSGLRASCVTLLICDRKLYVDLRIEKIMPQMTCATLYYFEHDDVICLSLLVS